MGTNNRLIIVIAGLVTFTGLAITLLVLGQPAAAIAPIIMVIVMGVQQLLQALDAGDHRNKPNPPVPLPPGRPEIDQAVEPVTDSNSLETSEPVHDGEDENGTEGHAA
ncbi:hypothetical protein [Streptomyces avermitilis]|uniref:hypothetical protein n=1 Tax=Streptomyces avermitilis TaxID=33903 RepID=UPI0033FD50FB